MAISRRTARQTGQSTRTKNRSHASNRSSSRRGGNGHGIHSSYGLGSTMRKAMSTGRDAMNTAYERASEMTHSLPAMRDMVPNTPRGLQSMANSNPMRLGAIGIGLGLLLGALVPFMMMADQQSMFRMAGRGKSQQPTRSGGRNKRASQGRSRTRRASSGSAAARSPDRPARQRPARSQSRSAKRSSARSSRPATPPTAASASPSAKSANAAGRSET